jgi:hypothetical protein
VDSEGFVATEKQFEFFKSLYAEETAREGQLQEHAKAYLSLATLYSAFVLFVVDKLKPDSIANRSVFIAAIACMLGSFLLSLFATKVSNYEAVNEPQDIIEQFGDAPMSDEEFFDLRIADYAVACERNSQVNDKKAFQLVVAAYLLLAGIALQACYLIIRT